MSSTKAKKTTTHTAKPIEKAAVLKVEMEPKAPKAPKAPTPPKGPKGPTAMERVQNLEACIAKMAHYNGSQSILLEFGIPKWNPEAKDMRKYRG